MKLNFQEIELRAADKQWSLNDLREQAGLGRNTLYRIRRGQTNATPKTIGRVAAALGCSSADIVMKEGD